MFCFIAKYRVDIIQGISMETAMIFVWWILSIKYDSTQLKCLGNEVLLIWTSWKTTNSTFQMSSIAFYIFIASFYSYHKKSMWEIRATCQISNNLVLSYVALDNQINSIILYKRNVFRGLVFIPTIYSNKIG